MRWLLRLACPHRVLVAERGGLVCVACGARFERGRGPTGRRVLIERARH